MKIKMNVDMGGLIKKIKFSRQEDKSDRQRVKQKRKGAIEFKKEENSEVKEVENVYNLEQTKKRRGKKEYNENDLVENGEKKKNWKRKGSKKNLSEFFKNIFLNQRQIKFNYYVLLFAMIILCSGSFYLLILLLKSILLLDLTFIISPFYILFTSQFLCFNFHIRVV